MKKKILTVLVILFGFGVVWGQDSTMVKAAGSSKIKKFVKERVVFGGDLGLDFGTITMVRLNPMVGAYVNKWWLIGLGGSFSYFSSKIMHYRDFTYGGLVFTEVYPIKYVVLHLEDWEVNLYDGYNYERVWTNVWYLGGGFRQKLGKKSMVNYMILWKLNQSKYFDNRPVFRILILF